MKNSFIKSAVLHGAIIGSAIVALSLIDWAFKFYGSNMGITFLMYVVMFGGLLGSVFIYRKQIGGYISYGQAWNFSATVSVVYAFISVVFSLLLTEVIDTGYKKHVLELTREKLLENGLTPQQVEASIKWSEKFMEPTISFFVGLLTTVIMSIVIALITSAIVKKNNPNL
ncbi:MAG: DUF4199 domain-containing protein [Prevotellaceae bacterium]|jgi:hypothetical protein|nr:DUF4199 domain-containing protein [Prevotellaceae bacterium]